MAERSNIDQLDDAISALLEKRTLDLSSLEELVPLLEVADDLVGLPAESFKAELKEKLLGRDMMSSPAQKPKVPSVRSVWIHLVVSDGNAAIDFYKHAFGAEETMRLNEPGDKVGHAELKLGEMTLSISDEYPDYGALSPQTLGGSPVKIHLDVTDVDAFAAHAIDAGAKLVRPIEDQFYGDRAGQLMDPFGYTWHVSTHIKDVPVEEMQRSLEEWNKDEAVKAPKGIRRGFHSVTPYITVKQPAELIDFVKKSFGATELFRTTGSAGGMHAEVKIGESMVMIGGAEHIPAMPTAVHLYVPDVDDVYKRAIEAGGKSLMEPADQPYGERSSGVEDASGNRWYIATPFVPLKDIAEDLRTVTVYFHPVGAQNFIDFVTNAFGGKELMRHADDKMILHAKVQLGDSVVELGEARYPGQSLPTAIYLYVSDVDAVYERAINAGGISMLAPTDQDYGDRNAWVKDPFDNYWYIATPVQS